MQNIHVELEVVVAVVAESSPARQAPACAKCNARLSVPFLLNVVVGSFTSGLVDIANFTLALALLEAQTEPILIGQASHKSRVC